ncbi:hypothetical protein M3Y98_01087200 [Aphelenchoides besseyi]|nr:hypothetical protein M3Y98_01087200 [Aphelenchoides besseyi]KAI6209452.1 hypothetical protein M3Y96_00222900 [Aphelenchoides besseyi]
MFSFICEKWKITVVPLLTEQFDQLNVLKSMVQALVQDCRWFEGDIDLRLLNKNHQLIQIFNFETQEAIDHRLEEFMYNTNESQTAYLVSVTAAIDEMPPFTSEVGRYVFVATNFERNNTAIDANQLRQIDRKLKVKGIQLRSIRLGNSGQIGDLNGAINIQSVRNVSSRFMRVSLVEADNIMETVRPCRPLSETERIRNIQFERDFQFRYWLANNTWDVTIGCILFVSAAFVALIAYFWNTWWKKREHPGKEKLVDYYAGLGNSK